MPGSNADDQPMFAMSGDGIDDVKIPSVFLYTREKNVLMKAITNNPDLEVTIQFTSTRLKPMLILFLFLFLLQISIMQMTGLKKRLETTLNKDEEITDDIV